MANPVTHILVPMFIVETYRRYFSKKPFSKWYVFLAGLFGAAPDFDLLLAWALTQSFDISYHRSFTHTLFIPVTTMILGIAIFVLYRRRVVRDNFWRTVYIILAMITIGVATHILLDGFDGMHYWFYPLDWYILAPNLIMTKYRAGIIDGILMLAWLLYDEEMIASIRKFLKKIAKMHHK